MTKQKDFKRNFGEDAAVLPVIVLKGIVAFPGAYVHLELPEKKSVKAATKAAKEDKFVFLVAQKNLTDEDKITESDLYTVGTIAYVKQVTCAPGEVTRAAFETVCRGTVCGEVIKTDHFDAVTVQPVEDGDFPPEKSLDGLALVDLAQKSFSEMADNFERMPEETRIAVSLISDGNELVDYIAQNIPFRVEDKQELLEIFPLHERLMRLISLMREQTEILSAEKRISAEVNSRLRKNQKDFYLREQLRAIQEELGEAAEVPFDDEDELYNDKIASCGAPEKVKEKLFKDVSRLMKMPYGSQDASVLRAYLDTCLDIPWGIYTEDTLDLEKAAKVLNDEHYGLEKVKERILEILAVRKLRADNGVPDEDVNKAQILCLAGPPGTGKTSIAMSVANAMNRKFVRVSLGGVHDEAEIRGHRRTYIGSMPGKIISSIIDVEVCNPVVLLDEVDKLSQDYKGDPASALLEVLDPEQNKSFRDNFIDVPFDLSKVLFITTANNPDTIPAPLLNRMDLIELTSYTPEEKFHIAKNFLVPKQIKANGLDQKKIKFRDDALREMIDHYTMEAGVRGLERTVASVCRKVAKKWLSVPDGERKAINVKASDIEGYIGPRKCRRTVLMDKPTVGTVNGLAYTTAGGEMMSIEVRAMEGTGKIELTGSLGNVMKESAKIAVSYIRTKVNDYGIDHLFYKKKDIHIHAPEGAIPKDGPSAGITMTTALISELTGKPVRNDVAMTGEFTLSGKVLPIGGLKEKTMAAFKAGIKTVIIPESNMPDLYDVAQVVKDNVTFVGAKTIEDVLAVALAQ